MEYVWKYVNIQRFVDVTMFPYVCFFMGILLGLVVLLLLRVLIVSPISSSVVGDLVNVFKFGNFK